jgi:alpha-tubulin suppressor-like RCC1 family protein
MAYIIKDIAVGREHSLGLLDDGTVRGWGSNNEGQIVEQDFLKEGKKITQIAAGGNHSLALLNDGTVRCWGLNDEGQCNFPIGVVGDRKIIKVSAGSKHSVGLLDNGSIISWGFGDFAPQTLQPVGIINFGVAQAPIFVDISCGDNHTFGLTNDARVFGWGNNVSNQIDNSFDQWMGAPILLGNYIKISCFGDRSLLILNNNDYVCFGLGINANVGSIIYGNFIPNKISLGFHHFYLIGVDGSIYKNNFVGNYNIRFTPIVGKNIEKIVERENSTLGLFNDGTVQEWNENVIVNRFSYNNMYGYAPNNIGGIYNNIAPNFTPIEYKPKIFYNGKRAIKIASGENHALALLHNGTVKGWRINKDQLDYADDRSEDQNLLEDELKFKEISCGREHSLGLLEDGTVRIWGKDNLKKKISFIEELNIEIKKISAGCESSAMLSEDGMNCYYWEKDSIIKKDTNFWINYRFITYADPVKKIICQNKKIIALLQNNTFIQYNDMTNNTSTIQNFGFNIKDIAVCPIGDNYLLILEDTGNLYIKTNYNPSSQFLPNTNIPSISKIACAVDFFLVLLNDQKTINRYSYTNPPQLLESIDFGDATGHKVTEISCGYYSSIVLLENGTIREWIGSYDCELDEDTYEYQGFIKRRARTDRYIRDNKLTAKESAERRNQKIKNFVNPPLNNSIRLAPIVNITTKISDYFYHLFLLNGAFAQINITDYIKYNNNILYLSDHIPIRFKDFKYNIISWNVDDEIDNSWFTKSNKYNDNTFNDNNLNIIIENYKINDMLNNISNNTVVQPNIPNFYTNLNRQRILKYKAEIIFAHIKDIINGVNNILPEKSINEADKFDTTKPIIINLQEITFELYHYLRNLIYEEYDNRLWSDFHLQDLINIVQIPEQPAIPFKAEVAYQPFVQAVAPRQVQRFVPERMSRIGTLLPAIPYRAAVIGVIGQREILANPEQPLMAAIPAHNLYLYENVQPIPNHIPDYYAEEMSLNVGFCTFIIYPGPAPPVPATGFLNPSNLKIAPQGNNPLDRTYRNDIQRRYDIINCHYASELPLRAPVRILNINRIVLSCRSSFFIINNDIHFNCHFKVPYNDDTFGIKVNINREINNILRYNRNEIFNYNYNPVTYDAIQQTTITRFINMLIPAGNETVNRDAALAASRLIRNLNTLGPIAAMLPPVNPQGIKYIIGDYNRDPKEFLELLEWCKNNPPAPAPAPAPQPFDRNTDLYDVSFYPFRLNKELIFDYVLRIALPPVDYPRATQLGYKRDYVNVNLKGGDYKKKYLKYKQKYLALKNSI